MKNREVLEGELGLHSVNLLMVAKYIGRDLFEVREVLKTRSGVKLWRQYCENLITGEATLMWE